MGIFGKKDDAVRPPVVPAQAAAKGAPKTTQKNTSLETTYVGKNLKIKGNISGEGSIIILGSFDGQFDLKGQLKIAQGAKVKGKLRATNIFVNGNIDGEIAATEKVQLENTARIKGGIVTPSISVLEGAMFDGEIKMSDSASQAFKPAAPGQPQAVKPVSPGNTQAVKPVSPGPPQVTLTTAPKK
jgi:cytoskeletal protein CcmA (bactofilin family)